MLSIVIPAYNEVRNLVLLLDQIKNLLSVLKKIIAPVEIIVADDGSQDHTRELLRQYDWVRCLPLQHSGMTRTLYHGVMAAQGAVIVTLDADMQNDPADIPMLINHLIASQADMVCGVRSQRCDSIVKKWSSQIANTIRAAILKDGIKDAGCTLRVFRAPVRPYCFWPFEGAHRFVGTFGVRAGLNIMQVPVNHRPRSHGRSQFGVRNRFPRVLIDLLGVLWLLKRGFIQKIPFSG